MRLPYVAGQFYSSSTEGLRKELKECFLSKKGPGRENGLGFSETGPSKKNQFIAAVMPHAGYFFSGSCAAHGYARIRADTYIIIGPSHSGFDTCLSAENWKTPLGSAISDSALIDHIRSATRLPINEFSHANEHSIEVQVPFIQYTTNNKAKIVPIMIGNESLKSLQNIGAKIAKVIQEEAASDAGSASEPAGKSKRIAIIASSDFTHYGTNYGFAPFGSIGSDAANVRKRIEELDMNAIKHILGLNTESFLSYVTKSRATICGSKAIALMLEILKNSGMHIKAELLKYYTSSDIINDREMSVSYGCIGFRTGFRTA